MNPHTQIHVRWATSASLFVGQKWLSNRPWVESAGYLVYNAWMGGDDGVVHKEQTQHINKSWRWGYGKSSCPFPHCSVQSTDPLLTLCWSRTLCKLCKGHTLCKPHTLFKPQPFRNHLQAATNCYFGGGWGDSAGIEEEPVQRDAWLEDCSSRNNRKNIQVCTNNDWCNPRTD